MIISLLFIIRFCTFLVIFPKAAGGMTPQADSPQGGQTYVIQHPWPGTEGPLTIKKQGVEPKVEPKKNLSADEVVVA